MSRFFLNAATWALAVIWAWLALAAAWHAAEAPKPLTADQRAEALVAALNTSNTRLSLQALDLQYRQYREDLEAKLKKAEADEQAIVGKLKKSAGAEACMLTQKAEWDCEKTKEKAK